MTRTTVTPTTNTVSDLTTKQATQPKRVRSFKEDWVRRATQAEDMLALAKIEIDDLKADNRFARRCLMAAIGIIVVQAWIIISRLVF